VDKNGAGAMGAAWDDGFDAVFRAEYPRVLATARLVVSSREAAEDITQEAFARLFRHWRRVSDYERPDAWLRTVAVRLAIQHDRRERLRFFKERQADRTDVVSGDPGVGLDVWAAVRQLSVRQRAVVALHYLEDRPVEEVAEILGCRPSTASVHLHRARARLAELLGEEVADHVTG
jgi:DNA-directed RNA polymerase specialized sigma24 family protein